MHRPMWESPLCPPVPPQKRVAKTAPESFYFGRNVFAGFGEEQLSGWQCRYECVGHVRES